MVLRKRYLSNRILFSVAAFLFLTHGVAAQQMPRCRGSLPPVSRELSLNNARAHADVPRVKGERVHGLVLLIEFADVSFTLDDAQAYYNAFFNEEGYSVDGNFGSVRDYYREQSQERFDIDFDVCGPIRLSRSYAYYGQNADDKMDLHPGDMMQEALDTLYKWNPLREFSRYDWEGDGEANMLFAVYAGRGENYVTSQPTLMWPHMCTFVLQKLIYDDGVGRKNVGGIWFDRYACSCELRGRTGSVIEGIGTPCHEFMHGLGIPDTYNSYPENGMGNYDLMGLGNYLNECRTPCSLAGFHKMLLGWVDAEEISSECAVTAMAPVSETGEMYVLYNEEERKECYVIENRQKQSWDTYIPEAGLMVTHVDYDEDVWETLYINGDRNHQRMALTDESLWTGLPLFNGDADTLPLCIVDVKEIGLYVSFKVKKRSTGIDFMSAEVNSEESGERYDLTGRKIPSGLRPRGLYIEGGKLQLPSE